MGSILENKRIYISGCGGMLGDAFYKTFGLKNTLKCTDIDINSNWLSYCDFREFDAYMNDVRVFKPDYLFHLGAFTDLEYCEKYPEDTYVTNTLAVENAVYIANELDIPLLYISTAGIFDGQKQVYDDWDTPNPMGIYAKSKYYGERFVIENARRYFIFRAGWMMGGGEKDKKFVKKILNQLKEEKKKIYLVNDKLGTPTYTYDFANNISALIASGYYGLYNMVCQGETSRLEVGRFIIKHLGLSNNVEIIEVQSNYFKKSYFAPRPPSEQLINKKLQLRNLDYMRDWKVSLVEYLESIK